MADKIEGYLEVGRNDRGEVVVNHPDLKPDANIVGHIVFSPNQAREFAKLLLKHAAEAEREAVPVSSTGDSEEDDGEDYSDRDLDSGCGV